MNDKLCSLIFYLIKKIPNLNKTEIVKLSYLADYNFFKFFNIKITGVNYKYHDHGPFSTAIYDCIDKLENENILKQDEKISVNKHRKYYSFSIANSFDFERFLNKQELEILDFVVSEYGNLGYEKLTELSYKTEPMQNAKKDEELNFCYIRKSIQDKISKVKKDSLNNYSGEPPEFKDNDEFLDYQYKIMSS
ncbi:MAG: SocA family protein [Actinomycetia bacterium]|nr:SocA family protein [Actinomycetes bacterium]